MKFQECKVKPVVSGKEWKILDPNNDSCPELGPYYTRQAAIEDRDGLNRFYKDRKNWKVWMEICNGN